MYNSFLHKRQSLQQQNEQKQIKKIKKWTHNYKNNVQPELIDKYSRRINNFVVRLQEDKKQLYEYRQETEAKAKELLKQIERKEQFLGDAHFKIRDTNDWNSILSTTQRIEKMKNKKVFQNKYGDANLAFRSIASQSTYNPAAGMQFRARDKNKELHTHNMRFTNKFQSFSENRKITEPLLTRSLNHRPKSQSYQHDQQLKRLSSSSSQTYTQEENKSHAFSFFSSKFLGDQVQSIVSNPKDLTNIQVRKENNRKIYFKQVIDLEQNAREPQIKKSIHQILVRFGISRIKDLKKQAMVETDNLQLQDF